MTLSKSLFPNYSGNLDFPGQKVDFLVKDGTQIGIFEQAVYEYFGATNNAKMAKYWNFKSFL